MGWAYRISAHWDVSRAKSAGGCSDEFFDVFVSIAIVVRWYLSWLLWTSVQCVQHGHSLRIWKLSHSLLPYSGYTAWTKADCALNKASHPKTGICWEWCTYILEQFPLNSSKALRMDGNRSPFQQTILVSQPSKNKWLERNSHLLLWYHCTKHEVSTFIREDPTNTSHCINFDSSRHDSLSSSKALLARVTIVCWMRILAASTSRLITLGVTKRPSSSRWVSHERAAAVLNLCFSLSMPYWHCLSGRLMVREIVSAVLLFSSTSLAFLVLYLFCSGSLKCIQVLLIHSFTKLLTGLAAALGFVEGGSAEDSSSSEDRLVQL